VSDPKWLKDSMIGFIYNNIENVTVEEIEESYSEYLRIKVNSLVYCTLLDSPNELICKQHALIEKLIEGLELYRNFQASYDKVLGSLCSCDDGGVNALTFCRACKFSNSYPQEARNILNDPLVKEYMEKRDG